MLSADTVLSPLPLLTPLRCTDRSLRRVLAASPFSDEATEPRVGMKLA